MISHIKHQKDISKRINRFLARKAFEYVIERDLTCKKAFIYRANSFLNRNYTEKDFID